jgi:hypothetical protein
MQLTIDKQNGVIVLDGIKYRKEVNDNIIRTERNNYIIKEIKLYNRFGNLEVALKDSVVNNAVLNKKTIKIIPSIDNKNTTEFMILTPEDLMNPIRAGSDEYTDKYKGTPYKLYYYNWNPYN